MRREVKKLMTAALSMAIIVAAGNTINSGASQKKEKIPEMAFSFELKDNYYGTKNKGNTVQRKTSDLNNAWGVHFKTSNEETKNNAATYTIFYIAEVIKNDYNKTASAMHKIKEGTRFRYYSAYRNVSPGPTALYAKDNKDGSTSGYTVTGMWTPEAGVAPTNDGDD